MVEVPFEPFKCTKSIPALFVTLLNWTEDERGPAGATGPSTSQTESQGMARRAWHRLTWINPGCRRDRRAAVQEFRSEFPGWFAGLFPTSAYAARLPGRHRLCAPGV